MHGKQASTLPYTSYLSLQNQFLKILKQVQGRRKTEPARKNCWSSIALRGSKWICYAENKLVTNWVSLPCRNMPKNQAKFLPKMWKYFSPNTVWRKTDNQGNPPNEGPKSKNGWAENKLAHNKEHHQVPEKGKTGTTECRTENLQLRVWESNHRVK